MVPSRLPLLLATLLLLSASVRRFCLLREPLGRRSQRGGNAAEVTRRGSQHGFADVGGGGRVEVGGGDLREPVGVPPDLGRHHVLIGFSRFCCHDPWSPVSV